MKDNGISNARFWLFSDGRAGITTDKNGNPTGIDSNVFKDLDAALKIAQKNNVKLDLVNYHDILQTFFSHSHLLIRFFSILSW